MTRFEYIKNMNEKQLAEFLKKTFWTDGGSIAPDGVGCENCINYGTHHFPDDCITEGCENVKIEEDYLKWLQVEM